MGAAALVLDYARGWWELRRRSGSVAGNVAAALRLFGPWLISQRAGASALADRVPWITFEAREWLDRRLLRSDDVFEYGSGGSTLYYALRCRSVVSVEHDPAWFGLVQATLQQMDITNCRARLVPPEERRGPAGDPARPCDYASLAAGFEQRSFRAYAAAIDELPDRSLGLVAVDGRARPSCVSHAFPKVKPGGYLLLDNSERPYYWPGLSSLAEWERWDFYGPGPYNRYFWRTTIWRRPEG